MKTLKNLLGIALLAYSNYAVAQFGWQSTNNPLGTDTLLGEIQWIDQNNAWISSGKGTLLHTLDGGQNWDRVAPFPGDTLFVSSDASMGMSWPDANHGYLLATKGTGMFSSSGVEFIKSTDAGISWTKMQVDSQARSALQVQFVDANHGWISMFSFSAGLKVLRTTDGGSNWSELPDHYITPFTFVNSQDGWGVATWDDGSDSLGTHWSIVKTADAGNSWQFVYTDPTRNVQDLLFIKAFDANTCIAEAPGKRFLKTTDGGLNWITINYPVYYNSLSRHKNFDFINVNEGWISEDPDNNSLECVIHHTTDGGLNWAVQHPGLTDGSIFNVKFFDSNHGLMVGETCYNCTDSLQNEQSVIKRYVGSPTSLNSLTNNTSEGLKLFPNPSHGKFSINAGTELLRVECYDALGNLVYTMDANSSKINIDLSDLNKGVYLLRLIGDKKIETTKVILEN